jgi:dephospho-CoA kinase
MTIAGSDNGGKMVSYPLFVVTGVSGSGKSTTAVELKRMIHHFDVFDMDIIVNHNDFQDCLSKLGQISLLFNVKWKGNNLVWQCTKPL